MQLLDFIKANGLSLSKLASEWGVSVSTISRPANGERWPTALVMVKAYELSGGQVGLADWIENCRPLLTKEGIVQNQEPENG